MHKDSWATLVAKISAGKPLSTEPKSFDGWSPWTEAEAFSQTLKIIQENHESWLKLKRALP